MFIKKFYDAEATETTGAAPAAEPVTIASLMATKGNMNTETIGATQIENTETNEEPVTTQESTPAVPAIESPAATQEPIETPAAVVPVFGAKPPVAEPEVQNTTTWQEVLKSQQPESVLKELGFDDKMVAFLNHWKTNGNVNEYLKELSTDYATMPAEDVMRHQLRREYPKANDRQLEVLYRNEIVEKYKIDPDVYSESEIEEGKLLLEAKADKYRDDLSANQSKFLIPPPPEKLPDAPDPKIAEAQEKQKAEDQRYIQHMGSDPYIREVLSSNKLKIGDGDSAFSFPIDVAEVSDILINGSAFYEAMNDVKRDSTGAITEVTPKAKHQFLVAAVTKYGEKFIEEYGKHQRALGGKQTIEPIENASAPDKSNISKSVVTGTSAAAMMAKEGRVVG